MVSNGVCEDGGEGSIQQVYVAQCVTLARTAPIADRGSYTSLPPQ